MLHAETRKIKQEAKKLTIENKNWYPMVSLLAKFCDQQTTSNFLYLVVNKFCLVLAFKN